MKCWLKRLGTRTWHYEWLVVASILSAVVIFTHAPAGEWIGAAAVLCSFGHAVIADRLVELEAKRTVPQVECHRWSLRYFVMKEMFWCAYFIVHRSWSALVGVAVFLAYPVWRWAWRRHHPMKVTSSQRWTPVDDHPDASLKCNQCGLVQSLHSMEWRCKKVTL